MASSEQAERNGIESHEDNGRHLGRIAAIAAASGATAFAAKKALSSRSSGDGEGGPSRKSRSKGDSNAASLFGTAASSGWDVAKDSLLPVVEDAARKAGSYVAERSPELVKDVLMPQFIDGFEEGRKGKPKPKPKAKSSRDDDEAGDDEE